MRALSYPYTNRRVHTWAAIIPPVLATAVFLFHAIANAWVPYGIFRDEYYYLACADQLAWGYVDHPPLSIFILWLQQALFGDTLIALRLVPALALAGSVYLCGAMVQRIGGSMAALVLACSALAFAPIYLAMGSFYSMNSLDILIWTACFYQLMRLIDVPDRKNWLLLGFLLGLGLLNKVGTLWLGAGIAAGLLFSPLRRSLFTANPYLAAGLAFLLFFPFLAWNAANDWAHLEFAQNALTYKYAGISRSDFLLNVLLQQNPLTILLWLAGLYFFLFQTEGKRYRLVGIIFLVVLLILLLNGHSKAEYLAPAFPLLFAGGAVFWQRISQKKRWPIITLTSLIFISNIVFAPLARPLLSPDVFISYADRLGIVQKNSEGKETAELPQFFADRFGWKALANRLAQVYETLSEQEKALAYIYTQNYGEAGAIQYYSKKGLSLPPVLSGHNNYWLWGQSVQQAEVIIGLGGKKEDYQEVYESVVQVATHTSRYSMPYENWLPIYICRKPRKPLKDIWPLLKNYN